jgi:hypothetical protein
MQLKKIKKVVGACKALASASAAPPTLGGTQMNPIVVLALSSHHWIHLNVLFLPVGRMYDGLARFSRK